MMKYVYSVFVFLFICFDLNSQVNLYLKPVFSKDLKVNEGKNINDNPYLINEHITLMKMKGFDVGFDAGVQFKKHFFEFQYLYTSTGLGFRSHYYSSPIFQTEGVVELIHSNSLFKYAFPTHRFSVGYQYGIFRSKSKELGIRLTANTGMLVNMNYRNGLEVNYETFLSQSSFPDYRIENVNSSLTYNSKINGFASLGFGFDFYTRSERALFSLDFSYTQGFKIINRMDLEYNVRTQTGTEMYNYVGIGRGSTLNITLSRRFQLYPWIKSKRKELQEQGVYKSREK